jgi:hypothetical protein
MYKAAFAQDLRYLFQGNGSLADQSSLVATPLEEVRRDSDAPFFSRLREPARLRSWEEHVIAISGLPLDSIHLLLKSELPENEIEMYPKVAASIIKTRHDLHFWEPLAALGLTGSFKLHKEALNVDMALMRKHCPEQDCPGLLHAWGKAWEELSRTLAKEAKAI